MHEGGKVVIYTSVPAAGQNPETVVVPDLTGKSIGEVKEITKMLNLNFLIQGSGVVVNQQPEPGVQAPVGSNLTITMEPRAAGVMEPFGP